MDLALALAPLGLAFLAILSGRIGIAWAGVLGAGAALVIVAQDAGFGAAAQATARGLWIAWMAISIILTGLVFQRLALAAAPDVFNAPADPDRLRGRTFSAVFLLGVFVESASGFGLGAVAAAAVLRQSGLPPLKAALLALLSLALVPWGALAIGTSIAAGLTGLDIVAIGVESALVSAPVLALALVLFWLWAPGPAPLATYVAEAAWLAGLLGLLWAANAFGAVDVAGVIAAGALFALRWALDKAQGRQPLRAGPFALFALAIVAIRLTPGLTPALAELWTLRPWTHLPGFAPIAHASSWLLVVGFACALVGGVRPGRLVTETSKALKSAWTPCLVTAGYVVLGEGMATAGAPAKIADAVASLAGEAAAYATPAFAALAGWLTGSNAAAHGMLADLQAALGLAAGGDPLQAVTIQNVAASAYTMLSPMRVALVAAALGLIGQDREIFKGLAPFAIGVLVICWVATALG